MVQITLTFSRFGKYSYKFDVRRPLGLISSSKLCHAVNRFDISVPRDSKPLKIKIKRIIFTFSYFERITKKKKIHKHFYEPMPDQ